MVQSIKTVQRKKVRCEVGESGNGGADRRSLTLSEWGDVFIISLVSLVCTRSGPELPITAKFTPSINAFVCLSSKPALSDLLSELSPFLDSSSSKRVRSRWAFQVNGSEHSHPWSAYLDPIVNPRRAVRSIHGPISRKSCSDKITCRSIGNGPRHIYHDCFGRNIPGLIRDTRSAAPQLPGEFLCPLFSPPNPIIQSSGLLPAPPTRCWELGESVLRPPSLSLRKKWVLLLQPSKVERARPIVDSLPSNPQRVEKPERTYSADGDQGVAAAEPRTLPLGLPSYSSSLHVVREGSSRLKYVNAAQAAEKNTILDPSLA